MMREDNGSASPPMTSRSRASTSAVARATSINLKSRSGYSTAAGAAGSISQTSQSGSSGDHAATVESASSVSHGNSWNDFQHQYTGRGWGPEKMRAGYWRFQASGKKPT